MLLPLKIIKINCKVVYFQSQIPQNFPYIKLTKKTIMKHRYNDETIIFVSSHYELMHFHCLKELLSIVVSEMKRILFFVTFIDNFASLHHMNTLA